MYGNQYMSSKQAKELRDSITIEEIEAIAELYFQPERFCTDVFANDKTD
jgi:predicted Zn-dependent peptidase